MELEDNYSLLQDNTISILKNYPKFLTLLKVIANRLNNLQDCVNYLCENINIDKAEGIWLDYIGWLVGVKRTDLTDTSAFFCTNAEDVNEEKYFWFANQNQSNNVSLQNEYYRSLIKAKIGYNTSRCTREDNIRNIKNMTFADHVIIDNVEPMVLDITLYGDNILNMQNMREQIEKLLGDGVGIRNLEVKGLDEYD